MLKYPLKHIGITNDYRDDHRAIDLGWSMTPNDPIFACGDGVVTRIYYLNDGGNCLSIKYDDNYSTEFMHIRDNTITVKVGDRVTYDMKVAEIGSTGTKSTGPHLHLVVKDPSNNRIDPKTHLYVYSDQTVSKSDANKVKYHNQTIYVGTPVARDPSVNQIEITINNLRCRMSPGLNGIILGIINVGIYNYYEKKDQDGYTWYRIENDKWISYTEEYGKLYVANNNSDLNAKIVELEQALDLAKAEIKQLKQRKTVYNCKKTDIYAIELNAGEKLYIE